LLIAHCSLLIAHCSLLKYLTIDRQQWHDRAITLTAEQERYLRRVLRLRDGDRFVALHGDGGWWLARLDPSGAIAEKPLPGNTELPARIILLAGMPKGNAFDEVVRQATELGVGQIVPVQSDRTLLQPSDRKLDRWRRIVKEAAEQSERFVVPEVSDPVSFSVAVSSCIAETKYICAARQNAPSLLSQLLALPPEGRGTIAVATGPEGGWTEAEIATAIASGFTVVSLGARILRAVTAAISSISAIAAVAETFNSDVRINPESGGRAKKQI